MFSDLFVQVQLDLMVYGRMTSGHSTSCLHGRQSQPLGGKENLRELIKSNQNVFSSTLLTHIVSSCVRTSGQYPDLCEELY